MTQYQNIVILTGAGISAESGIQTFRASDGLWEGHRIEEVATPEGFEANPQLVQDFYNARRAQLNSGTVHPNAAHKALAELEQHSAANVLLVTQNVDDLHERAGSRQLIHMHGELNKVRCSHNEEVFEWKGELAVDEVCPCCGERGTLRPHIVWFGEMPFQMERIYDALMKCDLFLSIGTSGNVYPAAGFVEVAAEAGAHTVELNIESTLINEHFNEFVNGPASEVVPVYVDNILKRQK